MSNTLTHKKVSAATANPDDALVDSTDWNTEHAFAGGATGDVLVRDTGQTDGARFLAGPAINVQAPPYNAVGNGVADDTVALQTALTFAALNDRAVFLPAGIYKITDSLWITGAGQTTFRTAHVVGAGRGYSIGQGPTVIDATAVLTKPALIIQRGRAVYLGHLTITGPNLAPSALSAPNQLYGAAWVTAGVRDSRYSPQCGIGIDVGMGPTPPDGGYAGVTYQNTNSGTLDVVLDNIGLRNCVVGLMHNPEAAPSSQGDVVMIRDPQIQGCKVGLAVGQSQARCLTMIGGNIASARDAINCLEYGQQQGSAVQVYGTQFGPGFQVLVANPGFASTSLIGIRTESMMRLGNAGTGAQTTAYPTVLINCDIHLGASTTNPPPVLWESASAALVFIGGHFSVDTTVRKPALFIAAAQAHFQGTQFLIKNRYRPYIGDPQDMNNPLTVDNCRLVDTAALLYGTTGRGSTPSGRLSTHWGQALLNTRLGLYTIVPGNANGYLTITTASAFVFSATTLTFTLTTTNYLVVGDILQWRFVLIGNGASQRIGPSLEVTSIVGTTITCALLYDRAYYDETYAPTSIQILTHEWAPGQALTGDLTNASPTIANVSPTTILQNGDWLKGGSGIPVNTRVSSGANGVNGTGGTATVTMSKNATATATGVKLYWGQLMQPRLEPSFDGLNDDRGTVTFASAATVAVTFTVQLPTTTYRIALSGSVNETFWVSAKAVTGFTINSSNATSTAVVDWIMSR